MTTTTGKPFPHESNEHFRYAHVQSYKSYFHAYHWCREYTRDFWNVCGDQESQVYRFGFVNSKDYVHFLLVHSNQIVRLEDVGYYTI